MLLLMTIGKLGELRLSGTLMDKNDTADALLEHAWNYFELHANQRFPLFNFFLVLSGAIAVGLVATLQGNQRFSALGVALGLLLGLVSFVFWKLDQRVSFLIKHGESALSEIEQAFPAHTARLFLLEPQATKNAADRASWWTRHWTYGQAFRLVFVVMGLVGLAGSVLSALRFFGSLMF
jgi:hypothetical protein